MNYAPLCSKKMIIGLAAFSFLLLVIKFFIDDIQFTEQQANFVSMLRSIYIGYFLLCLIYTGYIFSVRPSKDSSTSPLDKAAQYKNQESIVKFLKRPIILLITSAILLISIFTNFIFSFIAIFFLLGILWRMEYSHRRTFKAAV